MQCSALSTANIGSRIAYPNTTAYTESLHSYFGERPTMASPRLSCPFAIRSGGHATVLGASAIADGVTIDLSLMNKTIYKPATGIVSIQPGARWSSVYDALAKTGVMVPGGRIASVGVGGYLTGGGNSFYAAQVGLACDSVRAYEIVLADGKILQVSRDSNPDLFRALKGGSNNFGVVTMFHMDAFPADTLLWGGGVIYPPLVMPQFISAATRFTDSVPRDSYASLTTFHGYNSTTDQSVLSASLVYTRSEAWPDAFDDFYNIPNATYTMKFTSLLDLATDGSLPFPYGYRNILETGTYLNREDIHERATLIHAKQIEQAKGLANSKDFNILTIVQPWVPQFWANPAGCGGNVLGLERFNQSMIMVAWDYSWDDASDDDLFYGLVRSARGELDLYAQRTGAHSEYVYLNYAGAEQDPLRGYGKENLDFLRGVAQEYDPQGVFQSLVPGGFKL
ncbi:FAD-binding oxidoreductase [Aspergillus stella-maris]|uniref:FAD-binding oxidoreductase n=1 Tax=Aspergillus stella-maris TaxID=1810926 RepID=UPI003CCCDE3B